MTIEAAAEPTDFTATFTIRVNGIRTTTENNLQNVIKQVDWVLAGEESGQTFQLPQTTVLNNPVSESFIPLAEVTEANVISWVEANEPRLNAIKAHIQNVLDEQVAKANLVSTTMPWAPVVVPEPEPEQPPVVLPVTPPNEPQP